MSATEVMGKYRRRLPPAANIEDTDKDLESETGSRKEEKR